MNDKDTTIEQLRCHILKFCEERQWTTADGDNPKNLSMALSVEVAELLEIFTWTHSDKMATLTEDAPTFLHIKEEVADIFWYLLRFCSVMGIDLSEAVEQKTHKNAVKYPVKPPQMSNS